MRALSSSKHFQLMSKQIVLLIVKLSSISDFSNPKSYLAFVPDGPPRIEACLDFLGLPAISKRSHSNNQQNKLIEIIAIAILYTGIGGRVSYSAIRIKIDWTMHLFRYDRNSNYDYFIKQLYDENKDEIDGFVA